MTDRENATAPNGDYITDSRNGWESFTYQFALHDKDGETLLAGSYRHNAVSENPAHPGCATVVRYIVEEARIPSRRSGQPYHLGNDLADRIERLADVLTAVSEKSIRHFRSVNANKPKAERPPIPRYELMDGRRGEPQLLRLLATPERVS